MHHSAKCEIHFRTIRRAEAAIKTQPRSLSAYINQPIILHTSIHMEYHQLELIVDFSNFSPDGPPTVRRRRRRR